MDRKLPETLQEAIIYFDDLDVATEFVRDIRWPDGVECPTCGSRQVSYLSTRRIWKCKNDHSKRQFTVKVGTIFEDSPLGLDKWLPAVWLVTNCKNGISSYELSKGLGVTQKSGWFMLHRVRLAMQIGTFDKLSGEIEADETFIGGKLRNMHMKSERRKKAKAGENSGKTIILGLLERSGHVRAAVAPTRKMKDVMPHVVNNVEPGSTIYSDEFVNYRYLPERFIHEFVNHLEGYVSGRVHTNGIENFWALLKRTLGGTYISVDPVHLFRYLDEQCFRFNFRKLTDAQRFLIVAAHVIGRRLTYAQLTGKTKTEAVQA